METIHSYVGNFGVSILLLTLVLRGAMFPLANKSYESMSKMKKLQPDIEALKKKHPNEPGEVQKGTMALYQREHINPLMGCLPLVVQIPIFFSLYKVLYVTLEMRHAPFFGWIHDLSAPDPTTIVNLFGLIPWNPATTPLIGQFPRRAVAHRRLSDPLRGDDVAQPEHEPAKLHRPRRRRC